MAVDGAAPAAAQQPEAVVQPCEELLHRQHIEPRRGQLDGQRQPVQLPADRRHAGRRSPRSGQSRAARPAPAPRTVAPPQTAPAGCSTLRVGVPPPGRHRERGHRPDGLVRDAQRLLAGGQDLQLRAGAQQPCGQRGTGRYHVLAVVQHQQQAPGLAGARASVSSGAWPGCSRRPRAASVAAATAWDRRPRWPAAAPARPARPHRCRHRAPPPPPPGPGASCRSRPPRQGEQARAGARGGVQRPRQARHVRGAADEAGAGGRQVRRWPRRRAAATPALWRRRHLRGAAAGGVAGGCAAADRMGGATCSCACSTAPSARSAARCASVTPVRPVISRRS